jgi:response regulator RpfG family c-di-GMP phosphodiesterase
VVFRNAGFALLLAPLVVLLGLPEAQTDNLVIAGLLHDIGVSSTAVHRRLVHETEWDDRHAHCERGHELLQPFAHLSLLANVVLHHHTPWTELPSDLSEADALAIYERAF